MPLGDTELGRSQSMKGLPELDHIVGFLAVAEELNFRRAAERLGLDQSALSRRIKDLEARLGFQLLYRTTHAVRLTDAGRSFYDSNHGLLESLGGAIDIARRVAQGSKGSLRIAYMTFAAVELLPAAVAAFSKTNPEITLLLSYQRTQAQKVSLARGEIDIGLLLGPFEHSDFETIELAREQPVALLSANHPLSAKPVLTVRDVAECPLIIGNDQQWDYYRQLVSDMLAARGFQARLALEAPTLMGILGLVRGGLGITVVPEVMKTFCPQGLVARPIIDADQPILTVAAWRRPTSRIVGDFAKLLHGSGPGKS